MLCFVYKQRLIRISKISRRGEVMKTCLMCNKAKDESEFYKIKDKRMRKGFRLHSYCKTCKLKADSKWRSTHQYELQAYRECRRGYENINNAM